jgi:hypothetical protein
VKIAVAGLGYVGLANAAILARHNHVTAVDIVAERVDAVNRRQSPFADDGLAGFLATEELDLRATLDAEASYARSDFVVIATPTDYDPATLAFDTRSVESVIRLVVDVAPDAVPVVKSTVPVGFCERMTQEHGRPVLFSPEFLREGHALHESKLDKRRLGVALDRHAVALEFDVKTVCEEPRQRRAAAGGETALPRRERRIKRPAGASAQSNEPFGFAFQPGELQMWLLVRLNVEIRAGIEPHEATVAALAARKQHDAGSPRGGNAVTRTRRALLFGEVEGERAANDRLDPDRGHLVGELEGARSRVREVPDQLRQNPGLLRVGDTSVLLLEHCLGKDPSPRQVAKLDLPQLPAINFRRVDISSGSHLVR